MGAERAANEVLSKCEALKRAGFWLPEPHLRPRAWLNNFDQADKTVAASLLNGFVFYNDPLTDKLLGAAYESVTDGMPKGPSSPSRDQLLLALGNCVYTPVEGETPNPTDSGHFISRKVRQLLGVSEDAIVGFAEALKQASQGRSIVFIDDFVGSGDQFIKTWERISGGLSSKSIQAHNDFTAIYMPMVTTARGMSAIHSAAPSVAVCPAHVIDTSSTVHGYAKTNPNLAVQIDRLLKKYAPRLRPSELHIAQTPSYLLHGYRNLGLMFAFKHSVPDATLPIFWAHGINNWEPLLERT